MRLTYAIASALTCVIASTNVGASDWSYSQSTDRFTDEVETVYAKDSMMLRCTDTKFETIFRFDEYLNNDDVRVTYRFDEEPAVDSHWPVSTEGTATFVKLAERADFFRKVIRSNALIIKAYDFRGTSHFTEVDLQGSEMEKFEAIADQCGVEMQVDESVEAAKTLVHVEVRENIELRGPKQTHCIKDTLAKLGYIDASEVNSKKDVPLYEGLAEYRKDNPPSFGMESLGLMDIYTAGKNLADDQQAYNDECGGYISE